MVRPTLAAIASILFAAPIAFGQAPDPTDPLAKPAEPLKMSKDFQGLFDPLTFMARHGEKFPLPQDPKAVAAVRAARHRYLLDSCLGGFERTGKTKAPWAESARAAIRAYGLAFARTAAPREGVYYQAFLKALENVDPACDDPLIAYWRERHLKPDFVAYAELPDRRAVAEKLLNSKCCAVLAYHAAHNYRSTVRSLYSHPRSPVAAAQVHDSDELFDRASRELLATAKPMDWEEILAVSLLEIELLADAGMSRLDAWKLVDDRFAKLKANPWPRDALEGTVLIASAWDARGSGVGATVDADAFELFRARLRRAKSKLESAWRAEPTLHGPATSMLTVARGLGFPRAEMELWFRRAMEANPDNKAACVAKKEWLQPKWHGTNDDVDGFVLTCLHTNNYYGLLPYLAEVPRDWDLPHREPAAVFEYVRGPQTFLPFQAIAEAHLARYPDDRWARSRYAYHACLWKKWDIAHGQFELIGEKPWKGWFPHPGEYDEMKAAAKLRAGPK